MNKPVLGFSQQPEWAMFTLMQRLIPLLAFALVIGACASTPTQSAPDAGGGVATTQASDSATSDPSTTSGAEPSSAPTTTADGAPAATSTDFEGAPAPDFRLALADGSDFVLSDEAKPVYMIFWAEW
ncbi:MAG: hypothetical protein HKN07_05695 [Acidimicrobiia bacterium]|nr:hypothetical protein [Acidimicrobiia bacterium]